jgi:hypothetical protein
MRYSAPEKAEIIKLVEQSHLPARRTLDKLGPSEFLCEAGYPSCVHEALVEHDGELRLRLCPLTRWPFPFGGGVVENQI